MILPKTGSANTGAVALVTGSGRRLGRQIAYGLAESGFSIAISYNRSREGAQEAVRYIRGLGRDAIAVKADISNRRQVQNMVREIINYFKRIDVLVNNAGIFIHSPLGKTTDTIWDKTLGVNLKGAFLCSQMVSKFMLRKKRGRIINIASLGGLQAWSKHLPYSVSKAGVIMLTKCLAKSLAPDILVNAIAPGTIIIPGEEETTPEHEDPKNIALGRYGDPADITQAVIYLATLSRYMTGQTLLIDGGRYLWAR